MCPSDCHPRVDLHRLPENPEAPRILYCFPVHLVVWDLTKEVLPVCLFRAMVSMHFCWVSFKILPVTRYRVKFPDTRQKETGFHIHLSICPPPTPPPLFIHPPVWCLSVNQGNEEFSSFIFLLRKFDDDSVRRARLPEGWVGVAWQLKWEGSGRAHFAT